MADLETSHATIDHTGISGVGAGAFTEVCSVYGAAVSQSNGAEAAVACASENYDGTAMHSTVTNNSRITIATTGKYHVDAQLDFASNGTGLRGIELRKNGSAMYAVFVTANGGGFDTYPSISFDVSLTAADYLECYAYQNSGGSLNATVSYFNVRRFA